MPVSIVPRDKHATTPIAAPPTSGRPNLPGHAAHDVIGPYPTAQQAEDAHGQIMALLHGSGSPLLSDKQRQRLAPALLVGMWFLLGVVFHSGIKALLSMCGG